MKGLFYSAWKPWILIKIYVCFFSLLFERRQGVHVSFKSRALAQANFYESPQIANPKIVGCASLHICTFLWLIRRSPITKFTQNIAQWPIIGLEWAEKEIELIQDGGQIKRERTSITTVADQYLLFPNFPTPLISNWSLPLKVNADAADMTVPLITYR